MGEHSFLHGDEMCVYVVVQFYPWFKFYFLLFLGMVMYDNEFETKANKLNLNSKDNIEPQHLRTLMNFNFSLNPRRKDHSVIEYKLIQSFF